MAKVYGTSYDDEISRKKMVVFCKEILNLEVLSNIKQKQIDLISPDKTFGVEIERGHWQGDLWKDNIGYSLKSKLGYPTVNVPQRKEKYWQEYPLSWKDGKRNDTYDKNIFIRSNTDFTQVIVIRPETFLNTEKWIRTWFTATKITTKDVEEWLSFPEENVETYNLIEKNYILKEK